MDIYFNNSCLSTQSYSEAWLINSRVSFHMTPHRWWFDSYEYLYGGNILLGDEKSYNAIARASISITYIDGIIRYFPNVGHVHGLKRNRIWVIYFTNGGVDVIFTRNMCKLVRSALVFLKCIRVGIVYRLNVTTIVEINSNFATIEKSQASREEYK